VFNVSIWGGLEICLGGLSPQKPPVATGLTQCLLLYLSDKTSDVLFIVRQIYGFSFNVKSIPKCRKRSWNWCSRDLYIIFRLRV